jgi:hypothetical protein
MRQSCKTKQARRATAGVPALNGLLAVTMAVALTGCFMPRHTHPPRSATEQLLLSTATDRALAQAQLGQLSGRAVFLDSTHLESYDKPYVIGSIRDLLSSSGALLMPEAAQADIIVEVRSGALSIDSAESLTGIPATGLPIPLAGTVNTPEVPFYKSHRQNSVAKLGLLAYHRESREHLFSSGSLGGQANFNQFQLLFLRFRTTDIPERRGTRLRPGRSGN